MEKVTVRGACRVRASRARRALRNRRFSEMRSTSSVTRSPPGMRKETWLGTYLFRETTVSPSFSVNRSNSSADGSDLNRTVTLPVGTTRLPRSSCWSGSTRTSTSSPASASRSRPAGSRFFPCGETMNRPGCPLSGSTWPPISASRRDSAGATLRSSIMTTMSVESGGMVSVICRLLLESTAPWIRTRPKSLLPRRRSITLTATI